jgi:hypothetical protein
MISSASIDQAAGWMDMDTYIDGCCMHCTFELVWFIIWAIDGVSLLAGPVDRSVFSNYF